MAINYDTTEITDAQDGFTPQQLEVLVGQASEEQVRLSLQKFLLAMSRLGFGTDEDISGADAVGAIGEVFEEVTACVLRGQG